MERVAGRWLSAGLAALIFSMDPAAVFAQNMTSADKSVTANAEVDTSLIAELPDSPGTSQSQNSSAQQQAPASAASPQQSGSSQTGTPTQPSGTAAAPAITTTGNAASRPAGAAIAPPKQRRVRSLLIKFGFIAGAGVALGTVAALSLASPSRVPGSH
jgi:hypothetical protein